MAQTTRADTFLNISVEMKTLLLLEDNLGTFSYDVMRAREQHALHIAFT